MILADHIIMFREHAMMLLYMKIITVAEFRLFLINCEYYFTHEISYNGNLKGTSQILVLPTTNALLMHGSSCLISSSIGTGGTFSPPAVTMISLIRPVMYKNPSESRFPTSPVLYKERLI